MVKKMTEEYKQGRIDTILNFVDNRMPHALDKDKTIKQLSTYLKQFEEVKYISSVESRLFKCSSDIELFDVIDNQLLYQMNTKK